jgi:Family of unknown function (DUF6084)
MLPVTFAITGAHAKSRAATPTICLGLNVRSPERVEAMVLRAEIRIEPQWRNYSPEEQALLNDIFGAPERWGTTLRAFSWADLPAVVTAFEGETPARIEVPCTYDFDVTATRFLHALSDGHIPLRILFSGAIFYAGPKGFSCERVPWSAEASYRMPASVWRDAMRVCYGSDALLRVKAETLEHLHRMRALTGALSWDELFERSIGAVT